MSRQLLFLTNAADIAVSTDQSIGNTIVSSLNYDNRPIRERSVPQAHNDTFQWAFNSHLSDWLRSGDGTFWIAGKPGSGKSTFMKFIVNQPQTRELLVSWAGQSSALATASHFFWITGTPMQKSWQGLLQSLLFEICRQHAVLVLPVICPTRWAIAQAGDLAAATEAWSVTELTNAFRRLASATPMPLRFCLFIDGLDEYDSDHAELCIVLRDMARSPHIKLCVSSRPWGVFEHYFGGKTGQRLNIHDLTGRDIRHFVADEFQSHPRWEEAVSRGVVGEEKKLIERIADQADGVFIWAFLVTRSLHNHLSAGDAILDLNTRLRELPTELHPLFKLTLEKGHQSDRAQMAGILQAAAHALEPLHVDIYWNIERELISPGHATNIAIDAASPQEVEARRVETVRSITEKTSGLLKLVNNKFEFLHRTVRDFVLSKDMGEWLSRHLTQDHNGFLSIAAAYLGFFKTTKMDHYLVAGISRVGPGQNSGPFISHLNHALMYASEAARSRESKSEVYSLLGNYEASVAKMIHLSHITLRTHRDCDPRLPFREELVRHDLVPFITSQLEKDPKFFELFDESPLFSALTAMSLNSGESSAPVAGVLQMILNRGYDPNMVAHGTDPATDAASPWVAFSRSVMAVFNILSGPCMFPARRWNETLNNNIFGILLSHGADPNAPLLPGRSGSHTVFSHFLQIALSKFLSTDCFKGYLMALEAFVKAGASVGIPKGCPGDLEAFGNLARNNPQEAIIVAFCNELETLATPLSNDSKRAEFVVSVVENIVPLCDGDNEYLARLQVSVAQGLVGPVSYDLLRFIGRQKGDQLKQRTLKRHRMRDLNVDDGDERRSKSGKYSI